MREYFEFEVSLLEITPRIWRRFRLDASFSFADLHCAIQDSFGWEFEHMWEFRKPGRRGDLIAGCVADRDGDGEVPDAADVPLSNYFGNKGRAKRCTYTYDFGDDWRHEVKLTGVIEEAEKYERRLLDGARACPLEDCGGIPGYERMCQAAETGEDPWDEPDDLFEWLGDWQPDEFDLETAKRFFDRGPRGAASRGRSRATRSRT